MEDGDGDDDSFSSSLHEETEGGERGSPRLVVSSDSARDDDASLDLPELRETSSGAMSGSLELETGIGLPSRGELEGISDGLMT